MSRAQSAWRSLISFVNRTTKFMGKSRKRAPFSTKRRSVIATCYTGATKFGLCLGFTYSTLSLSRIGCPQWVLHASESSQPDSSEDYPDSTAQLSTEILLRNATLSVTCSVSSLVEITVTHWMGVEKKYQQHLGALIEALTEHTAHIDTEFEEELWSAVLVLRGRIYEIKRERNDLHLLWLNCQQLAEHSGQTAYLTGADFSGSHLGELLASSELNMSALRQQSEELQLTLALKEADEIRETVKRKSDKTPVGMPHQGATDHTNTECESEHQQKLPDMEKKPESVKDT